MRADTQPCLPCAYDLICTPQVCIRLREGQCQTVSQLCNEPNFPGFCSYSLFNAAQNCCPTAFVQVLP